MRKRKTVLGMAALVLALQGCSADDDTPAAPATSGAPSSSGTPASSVAPAGSVAPAASASSAVEPAVPAASATSGLGGAPTPSAAAALDGKRQVFLLPLLNDTELPDSVLAVTAGGRIQVTDDYGDRALFVPVPPGRGAKAHLIKTGTLRAGGEPYCLQVRANGANPLTVVTAACNAQEPTQLFTFESSGEDDEGRPTYAVRNRDAFLQWHPLGGVGLVAEELGDSTLETTFTLLDQGAATLPKIR